MSNKNQKIITFFRKNAYYFVFLIALAVIVTVTVALIVGGNNSPTLDAPPVLDNSNDNISGGNEQNPNESPSVKPDDKPVEPDTPTVTVVVFDLPVQGTIIKDYVDAGVVYNETLNLYSGHKAIDFGAEEGAKVFACYGGVIESITESKLEGITLTIDHGNGLKSYYNSIEVNENLTVGSTVNKGDEIGVVSTNNRTEYKDGAHLHFYVTENGEKINPEKYLLTQEK
jgi:murein DD-endopeptidase MepM/ murein hydrolase activator NlpD